MLFWKQSVCKEDAGLGPSSELDIGERGIWRKGWWYPSSSGRDHSPVRAVWVEPLNRWNSLSRLQGGRMRQELCKGCEASLFLMESLVIVIIGLNNTKQ